MPRIHLVTSGGAGDQRMREGPTLAIDRLPCVIGRATGCDCRLNDPMISRRHCTLSYREGQVWVEDLQSLNGTRVDGKPVLGPRPITDGATLQLGHFAFMVRLNGVSAQAHADTDRVTSARTQGINSSG